MRKFIKKIVSYNTLLLIITLFICFGIYVLAWNPPTANPPNNNVAPCKLVYFDATPPAETCPTNYYTWDAIAASSTGYMMCCRVDNPL